MTGLRSRRGRRQSAPPWALLVNLGDFADRPPRGLADNEVLATGGIACVSLRRRTCPRMGCRSLFEETHQTLFCSDLFHSERRR